MKGQLKAGCPRPIPMFHNDLKPARGRLGVYHLQYVGVYVINIFTTTTWLKAMLSLFSFTLPLPSSHLAQSAFAAFSSSSLVQLKRPAFGAQTFLFVLACQRSGVSHTHTLGSTWRQKCTY